MKSDTIVRRNPRVVARELSDTTGAVLLHLETGAYHGLNPVGWVVWELIDGTRTVAELVQGVRARIDDPPPGVEDDVVTFLDGAQARGLVFVD
jgi:Coenzyme PQQ synthesis protein D (PqqD)